MEPKGERELVMTLFGNSRIWQECDKIVRLDQHHVWEEVMFGGRKYSQ